MNYSNECECGRPKTTNSRACKRCSRLDGRTSGVGAIIAYLRTVGPSTTMELVRGCGVAENAVFKALKRMQGDGRVSRAGDIHRRWRLQ